MNIKRESIHAKESSGSVVDLSSKKCQEKMVDYLQYGVASSDKKGHSIHLQVKAPPIQADILESIKAKAPKDYWKTQSQVLRSVISLGCYVALKIFENMEDIPQLEKEFQLQELINRANKRVRIGELLSEAEKVPSNLRLLDDVDDELEKLRKLVGESD